MHAKEKGVEELLAINFALIPEAEGGKFKEERRQVRDPGLISL